MNSLKVRQSTFLRIVLALVLTCISVGVSCHQALASEPYSSHFDPYSYGYESEDNYGSKQWKQERSNHPHEVHGSYGYRDDHGIYREVTYVADQNGFRANIKTNEPGMSGSADKSPASTKVELHSPPHIPLVAPMMSSPPVSQQFYQEPVSHRHQNAVTAPVYVRQNYVPNHGYYQNNV